jgi:molecular chaperone GrpE
LARKKKSKKGEDAAASNPAQEPNEVSFATAEEAIVAGDGEDAADPDVPSTEAEPTLEDQLEAARREATEQAEKALRTLAEFDNYRRRMQRDLTQARELGAADVLGELLDVVDNFDRALEHAGGEVPEAFLEGMRLVAHGLHEILDRRGLARIEAEGARFDPELHEALSAIPSKDAEPNTVLQEIQTGWRLGDRVLRPAKVVVARAVEVESDS